MRIFMSLAIILLLSSCASTGVMIPLKMEDGPLLISFIISEKYYAEIEREDDSYSLFIPELYIRKLKLKDYEGEDGSLLLSNTEKHINIRISDDMLYFFHDGFFEYIPYSLPPKTGGDYYPSG